MRKTAAALLAAAALMLSAATSPASGHDALDRQGCTVRIDTLRPAVRLIFSADSMFEGGPYALDVLREKGARASFFFTGNFLRDSANRAIVESVIADGHYIGPHGDRHILLADWDDARTQLIAPDSMLADWNANYRELARFGVERDSALFVLPSYEWCNAAQTAAMRAAGLRPVNIIPGVDTYRDYTTPGMPDYKTSEYMLRQLWEFEAFRGLNGAVVILHLGTQDARTDKLYRHLPEIIDTLRSRGYTIERVDR